MVGSDFDSFSQFPEPEDRVKAQCLYQLQSQKCHHLSTKNNDSTFKELQGNKDPHKLSLGTTHWNKSEAEASSPLCQLLCVQPGFR